METAEKKKKLTKQQWFTLAVIGSVHFASAICVSLQAPFYPQEAESKNVTATEYGFVFGVFELTAFVSSPILGNNIDRIGPKIMLNTGVVLASASVIGFGLLGYIKTHAWFLSLSFVLRIIEALGTAGAVTSSFAITAAVFPDNVATTFATLEIFYGMGYIAGPSIGGCLYTIGGYVPPFLVMGSALLLDGVFVYFILPPFERKKEATKGNFKRVFKIPAVLLDAVSVSSASICLGFYSATLEPHIRDFNLSPVILGLVFVINGATYAATAPFVGMICDKKFSPKKMIMIGSVFMIASVFVVGPAPFITAEKTLSLVIIGLIAEGFGMSCIVVPAFIDSLKSSVAGGFPDDIKTYGLMSGLWSSSFSLGDFIGPSVAGALVDYAGFRMASMFIVAFHAALILANLLFLTMRRQHEKVCEITSEKPTITCYNAHEGHINPCIILEEDYLKSKEPGYGTIAERREDTISKF